MKHPKLDSIIEMMQSKESFELTGERYRKETGVDFPKDKNYAEKRSSVAKCAAACGYRIKVIPMRIQFIVE